MLSKEEVKILFVTASVSMARELLQALQRDTKCELAKAKIKVYPATDCLRMMELIIKLNFDLIIVEEDFLANSAADFVNKLRRALNSKELGTVSPPIAISLKDEKKPVELKTYLAAGFSELFVRPFDFSIITQKIDQLLPGKGILSAPELFKMQTYEPVCVAVQQIIDSLSEVEVTILSSTPATAGDVVSLYGKPFSEVGENREVVALCTGCEESFNKSYPHKIIYRLQGVTPIISKNIRQWIKKASVQDTLLRIS